VFFPWHGGTHRGIPLGDSGEDAAAGHFPFRHVSAHPAEDSTISGLTDYCFNLFSRRLEV
jgi:hypothetical protein